MQAIILAAGKGSRLADMTSNSPKVMLDINKTPLIKLTIETLYLSGIRKVIVAIGHCGMQIRGLLSDSYKEMKIEYVTNEYFESTNNIYTVWLCKNHFKSEDTLLIEGDVLFDEAIIKSFINSKSPNIIAVSELKPWMNGTILEKHNGIYQLKKSNSKAFKKSGLKTINIYKFSKEFSRKIFIPLIKNAIEKGKVNLYYENALTNDILNEYFDIYKVSRNERWIEIDNATDLFHAVLQFSNPEHKYNSLLKSYGGLWRSSEIIDFLYLSNPFFPPDELINELSNALSGLVKNYPSGPTTINQLSAATFQVNSEYTLVSNGASEMIEVVLAILNSTFGIFTPTFDEYINRVQNDKMRTTKLTSPDFLPDLPMIKSLSTTCDCIILINPNNPTGKGIKQDTILSMLDYLKKNKKYLIVDESFADFSSIPISLLSNQILRRYSNLFIIKSMGKSYGIPGLRLGALFTSNKEILQKVRSKLPIWNINSIAEYFFELFPRYKSTYIDACKKIQIERNYLGNRLSKNKNLSVFDSDANFIFLELLNGQSSEDLAFSLFRDYNILVKDCNSKKGISGKTYLRVAVKTREDNNKLIHALNSLV